MQMNVRRPGRARAAAVLTAGALALGLASAPSASAGEVSGEQPRRFAQVEDPRGDAVVLPETTPSPGAVRRLADLTRVRYRTPATDGGDLRIVSRWNDLRDGTKPGAKRQIFVATVQSDMARDVYQIRANNVGDRVTVVNPTGMGGGVPLPPEDYSISRSFGRDGRMELVLSTEWLAGRDEVFLHSSAYSGGYYDNTKPTDYLAYGPPPETVD